MIKNQRHDELLKILKEERFAEVRSLAKRLYASQPTIRRDLTYLEQQGLIHRSYGGAILADDRLNTSILFRKGKRAHEKAQICRLAAALISPESLIFADGSTTVSHLADQLGEDDHVSVVTNGLLLCHSLAERNIKAFSTGGRILKESMAFVGQNAEECARQFYADLFFFSTSSLSEDGIITDYSEEEVALRRVMLRQSPQSVFLCDSDKIGTSSPFFMTALSHIDYLITDAPLSSALLRTCGHSLVQVQDGAYLYRQNKTAE